MNTMSEWMETSESRFCCRKKTSARTQMNFMLTFLFIRICIIFILCFGLGIRFFFSLLLFIFFLFGETSRLCFECKPPLLSSFSLCDPSMRWQTLLLLIYWIYYVLTPYPPSLSFCRATTALYVATSSLVRTNAGATCMHTILLQLNWDFFLFCF